MSRFLDVYEYPLHDVMLKSAKLTPIATDPRGFRISLVRLATAIAKTMHCGPVNSFEMLFIVAEQISALQRNTASYTPGTGDNLRLTDRHFGKFGLRDFSKTTVEGQYAQGLSFLFAQDYLGIPALIDFDRYCGDMGYPILASNASKPDFVGCANPYSYWLVESKGNLESSSVKAQLKKGVDQCSLGAKYLISCGAGAPAKSYTTLTSFRTRSSSKQTAMSFVDPEFSNNERKFDSLAFLRKYYEGVLSALGYAGEPSRIWTDSEVPLFQLEFEDAGVPYYQISADDRGRPLFRWLYESSDTKAPDFRASGISKALIGALVDGDLEKYFSLIPKFKDQVNAINGQLKDAGRNMNAAWLEKEFFIDGTVVRAI